ncbi:MAG: TetR/AcrR family transcriptional regulator [Anaerobacillus sp.]|uniref:TetR/AcrR family transcriptional regulator n=1 Tax=Anaerobacillus sp. TaxID=1872506 RepID=UPI00391C8356
MNTKDNSKMKLLKTASRLFQLQGYHGTGLNQITRESGAPKGSLYYHFPNGKEELAVEAVKLTASLVTKRIENGINSNEDLVTALSNFLEKMAKHFQEEDCSKGVPIAAIALETSLVSEPLRSTCQNAYQSFETAFSKKLLQGGYEEAEAKELAILINSMIEGAFILSFTKGTNEPLLILAKQIPKLLK